MIVCIEKSAAYDVWG